MQAISLLLLLGSFHRLELLHHCHGMAVLSAGGMAQVDGPYLDLPSQQSLILSMAIRPVLRIGDPRLRQVAQPVEALGTAQLLALVDDLRDTMAAGNGVGLVAPQIGVPLRVMIFKVTCNPRYPEAPPIPETILINPCITPLSPERSNGWEGCLSVPGMRGLVPRWEHIRYQGVDSEGNNINRSVDGFHARLVQHEFDHLDGVLYPDRIEERTAFGFTTELVAAGLLPSLPQE